MTENVLHDFIKMLHEAIAINWTESDVAVIA